jgi:hypothetical protein
MTTALATRGKPQPGHFGAPEVRPAPQAEHTRVIKDPIPWFEKLKADRSVGRVGTIPLFQKSMDGSHAPDGSL